jgi:hypothetical protein
MNKQFRHRATACLGVAGAFSLLLGAGGVQAGAVFEGTTSFTASVSSNPSAMPVTLFANFFADDQSSTTLTGATVSTAPTATPLIDPGAGNAPQPLTSATLSAQVSGSADAAGDNTYAEATASVLGVTGILLNNTGGASGANFSLNVDWLYSAQVAAGLPDELARLDLSLLVNIVDGAGSDIDAFAIFDVAFLTDTSALSGSDSGIRVVTGTVPAGDVYNIGLRLQVLNGLAESSPQETPLPAPALLLGLGLPLLAFGRRRAA